MEDTRRYVAVGETVQVELPYSEVCMHMRVAGRVRPVRLEAARYFNGEPVPLAPPVAQILTDSGREYSFPILFGEAGFYADGDRYYTYEPRHAAPVAAPRHLRLVAS